jgi:D-xylonolactonase
MTDIHGCRAWRWNLRADNWTPWDLPERLGWILPCEGRPGEVLLGLQSGFALARAGAEVRPQDYLCRPFAGRPSMRLNDAKADSTGAVWAGSLDNDDESLGAGALMRLSPQGELTVADSGYTVANGPAIDAAESMLLHTDSGRQTVYAFDFDAPSGSLSNKRVWKRFTSEEGYPDGMCFDAEGCVWIAHWGGGCISRFDRGGRLLRRIGLPASHVTNVCFAGDRLERLFVTSARAGLAPSHLAGEPLAGAVFEITDPGVTGLAGRPCRIDSNPLR